MRRRITRSLRSFLYLLAITLTPPQLLGQVATPSSRNAEDTPSIVREASLSVVTIVLRDPTGRELGRGSGFVVSADGTVVTNAHVIHAASATQAEVRFPDGSSYQVQGVTAIEAERDLALVKLSAIGRVFRTVRLGDSDRVEVGQHVIAIGSPLGGLAEVDTETTVSDGIVSGIRDWPNGKMKVLQITAPLSPGSSGGALLNASGEAIGVTFAQLREGQNLNFAVPANYIRPLLSGGQLKSLSEVNVDPPKHEMSPEGSYTGVWQSGRFAVSGAATLTVKLSGRDVTAEIFLTGGEVKSATLTGSASKTGENIWTVELSSKHPRLTVRGIFRNNSFIGDYTYTRFLMLDQGQWMLKKE